MDRFTKNIFIVFAGSSFVNLFNLLYQLVIAHKLSSAEFAAVNSLLSIFMIISAPLFTVRMAVVKYCSEFNTHKQFSKIRYLLSEFFKRSAVLSALTLIIFLFLSRPLVSVLKLPSASSGYILAILLALAWFVPVSLGALQGLELFGWLSSSSVAMGALKLILVFFLIQFGFKIEGALGALLLSILLGLAIAYLPLKKFFKLKVEKENINYKEIINFLFPVAISYFCFMSLVNFDMVLVRYYFSSGNSGLYSLAQMVGKIFLFLPVAVSLVMFPRTSGLNARNKDTLLVLKKSLKYVLSLCVFAVTFYNFFPGFVLKLLTGKAYLESIILGRFFSISMSFFALSYLLILYFLSVRDFRFTKSLVVLTLMQFLAITLFHNNLYQVQSILCLNAFLLFFNNLRLVFKK